MTKHFDILILGGGPAGYSAAIHAARADRDHELSLGLVERDDLGGTCLNRGCIPTKTLVETAGLLDRFREAGARGIRVEGEVSLDLAKTFQYKDRIVKRMTAGIGVLLRENRIVRANGTARLARSGDPEYPFAVSVSSGSGETENILARKTVLATGSIPTPLTFFDSIEGLEDPEVASRLLDSDDLLRTGSFTELPDRLAILGGGVIGIEMGRIFKAFGSEVHLIEALPRLAPFLDTEVSETLRKSITDKKIKVSTGRTLRKIEPDGAGGLRLHLDEGEPISASHLLVAVGRLPRTDLLSDDLLAALEPDRRGFIPVDDSMKTGVRGLYAPGDVNGRCMLAHAAIEMGLLAADGVLGELAGERERPSLLSERETRPPFRSDRIPGCIYGEPEIGYLGATEQSLRERYGDRVRVGRFPFAANGRAASSGHRDGFVKILRLEGSRAPLGVQIVGPCASELINEASVVLSLDGDLDRWAGAVHAHPTYGEALVEAAEDTFGKALHLPPKKREQ